MEIKDFPNYLIYPDGRVFSKKSNKFKQPSDNGCGYKYVALYPNHKNFTIHRLVAIHYIPNPENKPEVDHIDRDKNNNDVSNLRWVNASQNNLNKLKQSNNKTGHKNISFYEKRNKYIFQKKIKGLKIYKEFKTLEEALEYKSNYLSECQTEAFLS
jgi:hypothetical protein